MRVRNRLLTRRFFSRLDDSVKIPHRGFHRNPFSKIDHNECDNTEHVHAVAQSLMRMSSEFSEEEMVVLKEYSPKSRHLIHQWDFD